MPYRLPPERPYEGPTDEELARIARACGVEPRWEDAALQTFPEQASMPLSAAEELRQAQERSRSGAGTVGLALMIALGLVALVAVVIGIAAVAVVVSVVPGIVSGVTK